MKSLSLIPATIIATMLLVSCQQGSPAEKDQTAQPVKDSIVNRPAVVRDSVKTLPNITEEVVVKPSDDFFNAALAAYQNKENGESARLIKDGINAYKLEMEKRTGKEKEMALAIDKKLEGLDQRVQKGEIKNAEVLKQIFRNAERINIHAHFSLISDLFVPEKQSEFKAALSDALKDLSTNIEEEKGKVKNEEETILKHGNSLLSKVDQGARVTKKDVDAYILEVNSWLERNI